MSLAVIMAGGEGKRLRPFTNTIPKPLLPIGRKPVAQIIVERLRDAGFQRIVMTLEYGADLIRAFFRDGAAFGVSIEYFHEERKSGTAGCLAHIAELRTAPFLVTNGDILTNLDYGAFLAGHEQSGADLTLATRRETVAIPYGVLDLSDGRIAGVTEKPKYDYWINAGVYALSPAAVEHIPADRPFDMTDLVQALLSEGRTVRPHPIDGVWYDLATAEDFEKAARIVGEQMPEVL